MTGFLINNHHNQSNAFSQIVQIDRFLSHIQSNCMEMIDLALHLINHNYLSYLALCLFLRFGTQFVKQFAE
jgi:hypothetical protein